MASLTVYSRYDSTTEAWDALLQDGDQKWRISVTTAFLYSLAP